MNKRKSQSVRPVQVRSRDASRTRVVKDGKEITLSPKEAAPKKEDGKQ